MDDSGCMCLIYYNFHYNIDLIYSFAGSYGESIYGGKFPGEHACLLVCLSAGSVINLDGLLMKSTFFGSMFLIEDWPKLHAHTHRSIYVCFPTYSILRANGFPFCIACEGGG